MRCNYRIEVSDKIRTCGEPATLFAIEQDPDGTPRRKDYCIRHMMAYQITYYPSKEIRDQELVKHLLEAL